MVVEEKNVDFLIEIKQFDRMLQQVFNALMVSSGNLNDFRLIYKVQLIKQKRGEMKLIFNLYFLYFYLQILNYARGEI